MLNLIQGDCLIEMNQIPDSSVDLILTDPPYGKTAIDWDSIIPFDKLLEQYNRILKKDSGTVIITAIQPFTSQLILSNIEMFKYTITWEKTTSCSFFQAKNRPLQTHEDICVFSKGQVGHKVQLHNKRMTYNPQGLIKSNQKWKRDKENFRKNKHKYYRESHSFDRIIEFSNYPKSVWKFDNNDNTDRGLHPTQKPLKLFEEIVKTFSNEGDMVLDNCMGSGTTGVACIKLSRDFIGIELDSEIFNTAQERIDKAVIIAIQNQKQSSLKEMLFA